MMFSLSLPTLLVILFLNIFTESKLLGINRGGACEGGKCELITKCTSAGDFKSSRPAICTFEDKMPVICCPSDDSAIPDSTTQDNQSSYNVDSSESNRGDSLGQAILNCVRYSQRLCPKIGYTHVIIGGTKTKPKDLPFMALLGYGEMDHQEWYCGGTVISSQWILSAAHCNYYAGLGEANWIRVGELDIDTDMDNANVQDMRIIRRELHPKYGGSREMYNDIALFKGKYKFIFNSYVKPICLKVWPYSEEERKVIAAGWGTTSFGGARSSSLLQVNLNIAVPAICKEQYNNSRLLPNGINPMTQICAGALGKDTCSGDSGGPLFHELENGSCLKFQIGITSFGRLCGNYTGVYTWLVPYIQWLEGIVWPDGEDNAIYQELTTFV